jgi:hypothetical protein
VSVVAAGVGVGVGAGAGVVAGAGVGALVSTGVVVAGDAAVVAAFVLLTVVSMAEKQILLVSHAALPAHSAIAMIP